MNGTDDVFSFFYSEVVIKNYGRRLASTMEECSHLGTESRGFLPIPLLAVVN